MIEFSESILDDTKKYLDEGFLEWRIKEFGYDGNIRKFNFLAKNNDELVGIISGKIYFGGFHITILFVDDKFRGRGCGSFLLEHALSYACEQNCKFAFLETFNKRALNLYRKFGFEVEFSRVGYDKEAVHFYLKRSF